MFEYHGYWFYGLRNNEIIQAIDILDEYQLLNCSQEYDGPFNTKIEALQYHLKHPNLSKDFYDFFKGLEEYS